MREIVTIESWYPMVHHIEYRVHMPGFKEPLYPVTIAFVNSLIGTLGMNGFKRQPTRYTDDEETRIVEWIKEN